LVVTVSTLDLRLDVSDAVDLGGPAHVAVTVHLPDPSSLRDRPVVCFAKPGGGYARTYYTLDLPGPARGAQANWHAERGWVFVSVDHLGVGESSVHADGLVDFTAVATASQSAEEQVLARLADGTLADGFPAVTDPLRLGIGQSMGGCLTVIQQGQFHCYDGIGVLGFSAIHTNPPSAPDRPPFVAPWIPRDLLHREPWTVVNAPKLADAVPEQLSSQDSWARMAWGFHYDDVDEAVVRSDMVRDAELPAWGSAMLPSPTAIACLAPGAVAPEAAAIRSPVLVAMGERDVVADPKGEARAYLSASSVDLFICPRMGHMHNFASTRELFWERIATWADWVRCTTR
jgi:alpha-beta hydrolase superfamily lysophospholipase